METLSFSAFEQNLEQNLLLRSKIDFFSIKVFLTVHVSNYPFNQRSIASLTQNLLVFLLLPQCQNRRDIFCSSFLCLQQQYKVQQIIGWYIVTSFVSWIVRNTHNSNISLPYFRVEI